MFVTVNLFLGIVFLFTWTTLYLCPAPPPPIGVESIHWPIVLFWHGIILLLLLYYVCHHQRRRRWNCQLYCPPPFPPFSFSASVSDNWIGTEVLFLPNIGSKAEVGNKKYISQTLLRWFVSCGLSLVGKKYTVCPRTDILFSSLTWGRQNLPYLVFQKLPEVVVNHLLKTPQDVTTKNTTLDPLPIPFFCRATPVAGRKGFLPWDSPAVVWSGKKGFHSR